VSGVARQGEDGPGKDMWYVYIIRSLTSDNQEYTGSTSNFRQRLADHNAGKSRHTAKYVPWELLWYCAFPEKMRAIEFEKYLKSHSGRAFATKRLTKGATHQPAGATRVPDPPPTLVPD